MKNDKIIILGAGLAGLSTAYHLENRDYEIFEKEDEVGGLCRSKTINGFTFDMDGHLLHFRNKYTLDLVSKLMNGNLKKQTRHSYVYFKNQVIPFPFQAHLKNLSDDIKKECFLGLIEARYNSSKYKQDGNFYSWMLNTFGSGITKHFMLPYNQKFWTIHPRRLDYDWAKRFVPVPNLEQILEGTLTDKKVFIGYNRYFWYPLKGGINEIVYSFARHVKKVDTLHEATKIDILKKEIKFKNGKEIKFSKLITTIPLPELQRLIKPLPLRVCRAFDKLRYTSIYNLNLGIDEVLTSGTHWMYFPQKQFIFFRVGFFNFISAHLVPEGKSSLYVEISYSKNKHLNRNNLYLRILKDLEKAQIISHNSKVIVKDINDIKYGYIIYDKDYQERRKAILDFLSKNDIYSIGRYGSWQYMAMEDTILDGKMVAEQL